MNRVMHNLRAGLPALDLRLASIRGVDWATWKWLLVPLAAFFISRMVVWGGAYLAEVALPGNTGTEYWHAVPENLFLDIMARWDSGFYINIARDGYNFTPGQMSSVAFFPLYPMLMNMAGPLVGNNLVLAGIVVSHIAFFLALVFLYRLTELEFGDARTAERAIYYLAIFPTALFFSAVYTESVFLLFSLATVYFARRRMWGWAAIMGIMTSASRIVGVLFWAVVVLEWMRSHGWTLSQIHRKSAWVGLFRAVRQDFGSLFLICLIPLGLISYMAFLYIQFGDPIAFCTAQSAWGRGSLGPFGAIFRDLNKLMTQNFATGDIWWNSLLNLIALFSTLALAPFVWRRFGASFALFTLLGVLVPAMSGTGSMIRYMLVLFPIFMLLAHWGRNRLLDRTLMTAFTVLLGLFTAIFVNWIFLA